MEKYHRKSIRLKNYDYSRAGYYFVTVCADNQECLFGEIANGKIQLNRFGRIVRDEWIETKHVRNNVALDEFVVMPNHVHGIIILNGNVVAVYTLQCAPTI